MSLRSETAAEQAAKPLIVRKGEKAALPQPMPQRLSWMSAPADTVVSGAPVGASFS
jgi:hypothetical protein